MPSLHASQSFSGVTVKPVISPAWSCTRTAEPVAVRVRVPSPLTSAVRYPEALAKKIAERGLNARQAEALAARAKLPETEKRTAEKDGDLEEISSFMTRNLGLKVKISAGRGGGGKVVLQYANPADLDKIIDILRQKSTLTNDTRPEFAAEAAD